VDRRILFLPLIWGAYGIGQVVVLTYLFGPIINNVPFTSNDKPIGGAVLPVLAFESIALLLVIAFSLYSIGYWQFDFTNRRSNIELIAFAALLIGGLLLWTPGIVVGVVLLVGSLIYLMATHID
jgi:hypothetical protein